MPANERPQSGHRDPAQPYFYLARPLLAGPGDEDFGDDDGGDDAGGPGDDAAVITRKQEKVKKPRQYKVLLHNDDYTPQEFVVNVLMRIFRMDSEEAYRVMMLVHTKGVGVAGIYSYEIAETKVAKVMQAARSNDYPLRSSLEPE